MSPYVQLLYRALASEFGIVVTHENPASAKSQFYQARKVHGDPQLSAISITTLEAEPNKLWLVKCPDEKQNLLNALTSGSIEMTSNGSKSASEIAPESPKPSDS